jgi:ATP synthase protein I
VKGRTDEPERAAPDVASPDGMTEAVRKERSRRQRWADEGETSVVRFVGQIGVLGWIIVTPTLIGLFIGRWLDHKLDTGIFWSAPLLMLGVIIGCWSAWQWINKQ